MQTLASSDFLEEISCPSCDSPCRIPLCSFPPYKVMQCQHCELEYLSPRLVEQAMLQRYAADGYYENGEVGYVDYAKEEGASRATFRRLLKDLEKCGFAGGSLLEVGCAHGYLLDEARPYFSRRVGVDFSRKAVEKARLFADAAYQGGVDSVPVGERFDCILLISVIEHVYDPQPFLAKIVQRLKPGGAVVVATPDAGSPWRRLMGRRWWSYDVIPEHVLFFDPRNLAPLMKQVGLKDIWPFPYRRAFNTHILADEFGILPGVFKRLKEFNFWVPGYYFALSGRAPAASPTRG